jgi:hypothetical protein
MSYELWVWRFGGSTAADTWGATAVSKPQVANYILITNYELQITSYELRVTNYELRIQDYYFSVEFKY